jgi:hypothetical protein
MDHFICLYGLRKCVWTIINDSLVHAYHSIGKLRLGYGFTGRSEQLWLWPSQIRYQLYAGNPWKAA